MNKHFKKTTCTYDLNGNLIEKATDTETTSYGWNAFDKLIEVGLSDGNVIKFIYDAEGNIRKGYM
ncbi:MAG: hypothetical protein DRP67_02485 [Candidatus Omnitrophota bacterium]|nr:MAG: hypothetical protein DRP67_02485 [Candidatus Omnitrophota bacterium]